MGDVCLAESAKRNCGPTCFVRRILEWVRVMKHESPNVLDIEDALLRRNTAALLASRIGVFEFEPQSQHAFWDDRVRELWGVSDDIEITYDGVVITRIHPDDREMHNQATAEALDPAGNGHLDITYRLLPREDQPLTWIRAVADCKFENGVPIRLVGTVEDITERKIAEERSAFLLGELQHRLKNTLAIVSAVIKRSKVGHDTIDGYAAALETRVRALADSHDILRKSGWDSVPFETLVKSIFRDFFENADLAKIESEQQVVIPENYVLTVSLLIYELVSNSLKHGALSKGDGDIAISVRVVDGVSCIRWKERGGPPIPEGQFPQSGFGSFLLHNVVAVELGAEVSYGSTGTHVEMELRSPRLKVAD